MTASHETPFAGWYFASVAAFMIPTGIQTVLLSYLLAIELHQPASRFGVTQMLGQLPVLVLLLFGGWLADRADPRRLLIGLQAGGAVMPLLLAAALWSGRISEALVLLYAETWGVVTAFATPARDGMLNRVAGARIQRMVTMATGAQVGTQMLGQVLGGQAGRWGPIGILLIQAAVLAVGAYTAARLPAGQSTSGGGARPSMWREIGGGLAVLFNDPPIRATFLLLSGMGVFFAGDRHTDPPRWRAPARAGPVPVAVRGLPGTDADCPGLTAVGLLPEHLRLGHVRRRGDDDVAHHHAGARAGQPPVAGDGRLLDRRHRRRPCRFIVDGFRDRRPGGALGCGDPDRRRHADHDGRDGHARVVGPALAQPHVMRCLPSAGWRTLSVNRFACRPAPDRSHRIVPPIAGVNRPL